jgi:hypothetical protein
MSSPRDRDGFEERPDEGSGWREPDHLGGDGGQPPADRPEQPPADQPGGSTAWQPPGWDLPPAAPDRPAAPSHAGPWTEGEAVQPEGFHGPQRPRAPSEFAQVFTYQGDAVGAQGWALQQGWTISDGTAPEDAPLRDLIAAAPVRLSKDHRPAGVMRGRADALDMVAFDVLYASGRTVVPEYAVTAVPLLAPIPYFRLSPARFWKHRTGGLVPVETGDPAFDSRWVLYTAEDWPGVRALAADASVRGLLLNTDDGDEFWAAAGHVAVIRPDGHRPLLIEHHARLLTAVVRAVTGGA